ncbi:isoprenoid synthase domain-containing protein [Lasiosphaeris hirsuta]|uniref:Terpene synthase n=1 Tax=Lasiosphaeris hirsuta TaxID=260670 RepID=A0AA40AGJ1_9PEZI|nr:isoprenoid synthase domain-containing protein [Lasiosphaeris hirsuta]
MDSIVLPSVEIGGEQQLLDSGCESPDSLHSQSSHPASEPTTVLSLDDSSSEAENDESDPNAELAAQLKGKKLSVPTSMLNVFKTVGWPILDHRSSKWTDEFAARYERLKFDTHAILDLALAESPDRLQKAKTHDFALFNILWTPERVDYEGLWVASLLTTWLFIWDDFVDSNDGGLLAQDFNQACAWRREAIVVAKQVLDLDDGHPAASLEVSGSMIVLAEFGRRAAKRLNRDQMQGIYREIVLFIGAAETEQAHRLAGYVPVDVDEYLDMRLLSSAVLACFFSEEVFFEIALPDWVLYSDEMKVIFRDGNYLISIHNDILSLKKEIVDNCIINMIPVLYFGGMPWEQIISHLQVELEACCRRVDKAAEALLEKTAGDAQLSEAVESLVYSVRMNTTGNLGYLLASSRYSHLDNEKTEDGSLEIVL